jgi:hypothetical protein
MYQVEQLKGIGGSEWKTADGRKHRVYFSLADLLGVEVDTYKTGNIAAARRHGRPVSNSLAGKMTTGKIWIDMTDGKIWSQLDGNFYKDEIVEALRERLATI